MEALISEFLKIQIGDGSGSGDGYGYGYGYGSGYGSGSGYGYGDGDGYGYGYGSGYGSGYGMKTFCGSEVHMIEDVPTILPNVHGSVARGYILQDDLQLTPCYVVKGNNLFAHGETLEEAEKALEEKILGSLPIEEKIGEFLKKFSPGQEYPVRDFYDWHHFLTGSCEMGRRQFALEHDIRVDEDKMTPEAFMDLTKDAYGGAVIRQLTAAWKEKHPGG